MPRSAPLHVRPAPGRRVTDPRTGRPLPERGARVPATQYWHRRLADGDVVEVTSEPAPSPTPPSQE